MEKLEARRQSSISNGTAPEPCRTIIQLAVLTGLRIGEILALRWKGVDLPRGTIEVAKSYSDGEFGSPKT